jgi:hypothetical protein
MSSETQTVQGSCHCGTVRIEVPAPTEWVVSCNCSLCRRTGALMAYFPPDAVRVEGATTPYLTGDRFIRLHHCPTCACHTHWDANAEALAGDLPDGVRAALTTRMGVNARLLDGFELREGASNGQHHPPDGAAWRYFLSGVELEVRLFDNAG